MSNPAPGFKARPDHSIKLTPGTRVTVTLDGEPVAASQRAVMLAEKGYPARAYVPPGDVSASLSETDKTTYCPYKGNTRYFTVSAGGQVLENAAWSYPAPFDEMASIVDLVAFDDRFSIAVS